MIGSVLQYGGLPKPYGHWRSRIHVAIVPLLVAGSGFAQQCASGPPTKLGSVQLVSAGCKTGTLPRTTCRTLRVTCEGIPPIDVQVRVTEPDPGTGLRGTIVFGTGGGGTGFYADRAGGTELLRSLLAKGFRTVDRRWLQGWFTVGSSVRKQSCRYTTLLTWIHQNVHTTGVFCATGNSGGSAEIDYALAAWRRGDIVDVVVRRLSSRESRACPYAA